MTEISIKNFEWCFFQQDPTSKVWKEFLKIYGKPWSFDTKGLRKIINNYGEFLNDFRLFVRSRYQITSVFFVFFFKINLGDLLKIKILFFFCVGFFPYAAFCPASCYLLMSDIQGLLFGPLHVRAFGGYYLIYHSTLHRRKIFCNKYMQYKTETCKVAV